LRRHARTEFGQRHIGLLSDEFTKELGMRLQDSFGAARERQRMDAPAGTKRAQPGFDR